MLANILAIAVGLGSFAVYMAAFFFPEVHRKNDFFWSGVGLFYALILWLCAGQITGAVLLGQMASVALLGWFGFQTLYLRRLVTPASLQTPVPAQVQEGVSRFLAVQAEAPQVAPTPTTNAIAQQTPPPVTSEPPAESAAIEPPVETVETEPEIIPEIPSETAPEIEEAIAEVPAVPEAVPTSETEVKPEPVAAIEEVEFEDEFDEFIEGTEEKIETTSQPQVAPAPAPQPKRLSRVFRAITGLFDRRKTQPAPAVSQVETPAETQPETLAKTPTEAPEVQPEVEEIPTLETVVAQEDVTAKSEEPETSPVAETETVDLSEIDSAPVSKTPPSEEVQEIVITVEPDMTSASSFEKMASASEKTEENLTPIFEEPPTAEREDDSEEIVAEPVEEAAPAVESSPETEPASAEENPALKRPTSPDPKLKEASKKPEKLKDSEQ